MSQSAYVIWHHIYVAHITPGYSAYLSLDKEMITRATIVDNTSNLKLNQNLLGMVHLDHQCDTFKINNALVYQILSKVFTDMDVCVYIKQRKSTQDGQAVFFGIRKQFLGPDNMQQMQKESCRTPTMMVRRKGAIGTSLLHPTKNSMPSWRALQLQ